jgi:hypothetical protein
MASGGPRGNGGRVPDPNAARRDRPGDSEWTTLPAAREGEAPRWPLPDPTARELELWAGEWRRPQAVVWERNGQQHEVALYVRRLAEVELPNAPTNLGTLVKQMQENLGLSIPGMLRNRWKIASDEVAEQAARRTPQQSSRRRMKVVRDAAEA